MNNRSRNRSRTRARALAVAGSAALLATLMAAAPAPAAPAGAKLASVHGLGTVFYPYSPDDDIRFTVDATSAPWSRPLPAQGGEKGLPTDAFGRITVYHHVTASGYTAVSEAEVDCLVTGGRTATVTAVVKTSNVGWEGRRIGIGVQDGTRGEPDRVGFSWDIANLEVRPDGSVFEPSAGTCLAPAPFTEVTKDGYKVTPAPLAPRPKP
ncbi:hypothetical protein ADK75_15180 [Streptomyces virginiae]|uniref:Repetin n=1 Tax=Streptomyces virginiae TaxID=1961 RepID=A0A0L8MSI8_STRVG|nr:hypothetical protein [Streptomyces virginiae]KOG53275.1 hypothetical protein ADK75_15180 [Streptomyces virginiae]